MASKRKTESAPYPVQRCIPLSLAAPDTFPVAIVKGSECLSKVNYRLMREARIYRMKLDLTDAITGSVHVFALRNDYALRGAVKMAHSMWRKNTAEERRQGGLSKWYDFKIDFGLGENVTPVPHVNVYLPTNSGPVTSNVAGVNVTNMSGVPYTAGEFELSEVQSEDNGQVKTFTLKPSPLTSQWGILSEYNLRGNVDVSAPAETDTPYAGLMDTHDPAVAQHLQEDGDLPPYNATTYGQDSPWVHVATIRSDSNGRLMSTGWIDAPLGVLAVASTGNGIPGEGELCLEFAPGDYKGVKSWSMI